MRELSMVEAIKIAGNMPSEKKQILETFIKKFIKNKNYKKIKEELEALENIKIKSKHIAKIIEIMPEDASDIYSIFTDVSLDDNEISQILEIIKKNK